MFLQCYFKSFKTNSKPQTFRFSPEHSRCIKKCFHTCVRIRTITHRWDYISTFNTICAVKQTLMYIHQGAVFSTSLHAVICRVSQLKRIRKDQALWFEPRTFSLWGYICGLSGSCRPPSPTPCGKMSVIVSTCMHNKLLVMRLFISAAYQQIMTRLNVWLNIMIIYYPTKKSQWSVVWQLKGSLVTCVHLDLIAISLAHSFVWKRSPQLVHFVCFTILRLRKPTCKQMWWSVAFWRLNHLLYECNEASGPRSNIVTERLRAAVFSTRPGN